MARNRSDLPDPGAELADEARRTSFIWLLIRGILALVLGVLLFFAPGLGALTITYMVGFWLILDGIASAVLAVQLRKADLSWGMTLFGGIVAVISGLIVVSFPVFAAVVGGLFVLWALAIGLLIRGIAEVGSRTLGGWGVVLGIINILFAILLGVMLVSNPAATLIALVWVAAVFGVVFGIATIVLAFRVRNA